MQLRLGMGRPDMAVEPCRRVAGGVWVAPATQHRPAPPSPSTSSRIDFHGAWQRPAYGLRIGGSLIGATTGRRLCPMSGDGDHQPDLPRA